MNAPTDSYSVGQYLALRLAELGVGHFFTVPGDFNLILLDEFLKIDRLTMISCCNELNAGYAADGYARASGGPAAVVVTYSVGGLSLLNAVAGAYAEDLPVIAISGGPNTNATAEYELLHHTLGVVDYDYVRKIFAHVTATAVAIQHPSEAPSQIDRALETALQTRKPVYLEVACNIASAPVSKPNPRVFVGLRPSDPQSLQGALAHAETLLNQAAKPVLVAGVKLRAGNAEAEFRAVADASGYAVAVMPNAKSFFDEQHPNSIGTYWGPVSSPGCSSVVESADLCVYVGAIFSDYTTTGHTMLIDRNKMIDVRTDSVVIAGETYNGVTMRDFLRELAGRVQRNDASLQSFQRAQTESPTEPSKEPLTTRQLFAQIEQVLTPESTVIAETGDSWFNGVSLQFPSGARFEIQMQYGSIGWSVGATLGYCLGAPNRKVIACIGDGSFQLTAQEVSTMLRYNTKPIIILINNRGYTIEAEIHDGPYNRINNWKYSMLVDVFKGDNTKGWGCCVTTEADLADALGKAIQHDGLSLIEVPIDRDDCSENLLKWGACVAKNNRRPARFR